MEEALRLMAVKRDVGGVQIEHDLGGRRGVRLDEKIRQQPVQRFSRVTDLVIADGLAGQLQPVRRALAGQRLIQIPLARSALQQRPAVAEDLAGGKPSFHAARKVGCKCEHFLFTLCHQKGRLSSATTTCR